MSQYIQVGIILITVPNLIVIGLMVLVFAVAVALKIPESSATSAGAENNERSLER
jgi:hypothetical protein